MTETRIPGFGRKRPLLDVSITRLYLDASNPRLPEEAQGKSEPELLSILYKKFYLDELAVSMAKNGYFDEEPLVSIPRKLPKALENVSPNSKRFLTFLKKKNTDLIVVEGNRRLATAKLLLNLQLRETLRIRHWPEVPKAVVDDLAVLPTIVYSKRSEVAPYLGVRHIIGIQKWDSYGKARYIAKMIREGSSISALEAQIGDKQGTVIRNYVCFQLLEQAKNEFDFDTGRAQEDFSLLLLAIGQGNIKVFLGLPKKLADVNLREPIPKENVSNFQDLVYWIFGNGHRKAVIEDSREITKYLSHVVSSPEALSYLRSNRDLIGAYERSDGEEKLLMRYLGIANQRLESALGIAHRHRTSEVISEVEKCENTAKTLLKTLKEPAND